MSILHEIINPALARTRNGVLESIDDTDDTGQKAVVFFVDLVREAMGTYPWPFLTKSVELERTGSNDTRREYRNTYRMPPDYLHIWDFYVTLDRRPNYALHYDWRGHHSPLSYPLHDYDGAYNKLGRITDHSFRSDSDRIYALYTPRPKEDDGATGLRHLDISRWTPQLKTWVKKELMVALEQGHSGDVEKALPLIGMHRKDAERMKTQASVENRKAHRLDEPLIINQMRGTR